MVLTIKQFGDIYIFASNARTKNPYWLGLQEIGKCWNCGIFLGIQEKPWSLKIVLFVKKSILICVKRNSSPTDFFQNMDLEWAADSFLSRCFSWRGASHDSMGQEIAEQ